MGLTRQRSRTDGHSWYRTALIASLVLSGASLFLQFIGFVTPGWIVLTSPTGVSISAGVWYLQICKAADPDSRCVTASTTRIDNPFNMGGDRPAEFINMTEVQVETTLALVAAIASILLSAHAYMERRKLPRLYLTGSAATGLCSAGLLSIPICRLIIIIRNWESHIKNEIPYSLVSSGIGVVTSLINAFLCAIATCMVFYDLRNERQRNSEERKDLTVNSA